MNPTLRQTRPVPGVRTRIAAGPTAPARARDALVSLRSWLGEECLQKLELIVSELVTNAVRHSGAGPGAPIGLDVRCGARSIRVTVEDPGRGCAPGPDVRDAHEPGGWGLLLITDLADTWWVEPGSPARVVAELDR